MVVEMVAVASVMGVIMLWCDQRDHDYIRVDCHHAL
jgi:hypothetical protein